MINITRFNPLDDAVDELLRGFFVRPTAFAAAQTPVQAIPLEVREDEQAYVVLADMPGVNKEDIQVTVENDQVAISAQTREARELREGERLLRAERHCGRLHRSFTLGQPVDQDRSGARYSDGVLELTLPKKTAAASKRITIN